MTATTDRGSGTAEQRERGVVGWFNSERGVGFIRSAGGGPDVFVHFSEIAGSGFRTHRDREPVTYHLDRAEHPLQARNVRALETRPQHHAPV